MIRLCVCVCLYIFLCLCVSQVFMLVPLTIMFYGEHKKHVLKPSGGAQELRGNHCLLKAHLQAKSMKQTPSWLAQSREAVL